MRVQCAWILTVNKQPLFFEISDEVIVFAKILRNFIFIRFYIFPETARGWQSRGKISVCFGSLCVINR